MRKNKGGKWRKKWKLELQKKLKAFFRLKIDFCDRGSVLFLEIFFATYLNFGNWGLGKLFPQPLFKISGSNLSFLNFSVKETNAQQLQEEYEQMVRGLKEAQDARISDRLLANPVLPNEVLQGLFSKIWKPL